VTSPNKVCIIGLGSMGGPMADNLIAAGHDVSVFDVNPAAVEARVVNGARSGTSPADAASDADLVCIVVVDDSQVVEVITGPSGVLGALSPDAVVAIHSTVSLDTIERMVALTTEHGMHLLDAGISGGVPGATNGTLLTMVGGDAEIIERVTPALLAFSKEVLHAGPTGSGMALKLARNATGYMMMAAVHEALALTTRSGIDPSVLLHTITQTGVLDQALAPFSLGGPTPLPEDAPADTRHLLEHLLALGEKDLDQALALADRLDVEVPVTAATRDSFATVTRLGS
jgi:3-hydroxyisobutyrate dehydrogenase-like beta-hydroxyacid dehydrogenase